MLSPPCVAMVVSSPWTPGGEKAVSDCDQPGPGSGGRDHSWEKISSGELLYCDDGDGLVEEDTAGTDSLPDRLPLPGVQPDGVLLTLPVLGQPELQQRQPLLQGLC